MAAVSPSSHESNCSLEKHGEPDHPSILFMRFNRGLKQYLSKNSQSQAVDLITLVLLKHVRKHLILAVLVY